MIYLCVAFYCLSKIERVTAGVFGPILIPNHRLEGLPSALKWALSEPCKNYYYFIIETNYISFYSITFH